MKLVSALVNVHINHESAVRKLNDGICLLHRALISLVSKVKPASFKSALELSGINTGINSYKNNSVLQIFIWYHQQESNLYLALRRHSFYPLNYGGKLKVGL